MSGQLDSQTPLLIILQGRDARNRRKNQTVRVLAIEKCEGSARPFQGYKALDANVFSDLVFVCICDELLWRISVQNLG